MRDVPLLVRAAVRRFRLTVRRFAMDFIDLQSKAIPRPGHIEHYWFENENTGLKRTRFHRIVIPFEPFDSGLDYVSQPETTELVVASRSSFGRRRATSGKVDEAMSQQPIPEAWRPLLREVVRALPEETWRTSCAQPVSTDRCEVLVDLWTAESGRNDMVLDGWFDTSAARPTFHVHMVYVP